jgi:hypothetical protein
MPDPRYRVQLPDGRMTKPHTRDELFSALKEDRLPEGSRIEVNGALVSPDDFFQVLQQTTHTPYKVPAFKAPDTLGFVVVVSALMFCCSIVGCVIGLANATLFAGSVICGMLSLFMIAFAEAARAALKTLHHIRVATERAVHKS